LGGLQASGQTKEESERSGGGDVKYGEEAIIPLELLVPSLRLAVKFRLGDKESMARRLQKLVTMEEDRNHAEWSTQARQQQRKADTDRRRGGMDAQVFKYNGKSLVICKSMKVNEVPLR
jgi:hypothetical protein